MMAPAPRSVDSLLGVKLLTGVLSLTAGSMDVIGFLGLGGLFTAHITGNIVVLAAHVVSAALRGRSATPSVPVFMFVLCLARLLAGGFEAIGPSSLRPLLLLQLLFLAGSLFICVAAGQGMDPNAAIATVVGILGVSAMAVHNALAQVSLPGAPATAVATTNIARFMTDVGTLLLGSKRDEMVAARKRANRICPSIVGFVIGCGFGAVCEAHFGLRALALPAGLALLGLAMAQVNKPMVESADGFGPDQHSLPFKQP